MKDFVYYLKEEGELLPELIFESEEAAIEYAEMVAMKDYEIVKWDVD